jgi:hypothetical protein
MSDRPKGKYVRVDFNNPQAVGICDYSGFVFNRCDLQQQMEWRGDRLVWTGFYVAKRFMDKPNEQLRPPVLMPDPIPILWPRLPQGESNTASNNVITDSISNISFAPNEIGSDFDGVLAPSDRLSNLESGTAPSLKSNGGINPENDTILTTTEVINALNSVSFMS